MIIAVFFVIPIIASWMVYEKAGRHGWSALIPFHSTIRLFEIAGKPGWWMFLYLVPFLNIFVHAKMLIGLSKNFGHGVGFAIGLWFLPFVFYPILGFGKSEYLNLPADDKLF